MPLALIPCAYDKSTTMKPVHFIIEPDLADVFRAHLEDSVEKARNRVSIAEEDLEKAEALLKRFLASTAPTESTPKALPEKITFTPPATAGQRAEKGGPLRAISDFLEAKGRIGASFKAVREATGTANGSTRKALQKLQKLGRVQIDDRFCYRWVGGSTLSEVNGTAGEASA